MIEKVRNLILEFLFRWINWEGGHGENIQLNLALSEKIEIFKEWTGGKCKAIYCIDQNIFCQCIWPHYESHTKNLPIDSHGSNEMMMKTLEIRVGPRRHEKFEISSS